MTRDKARREKTKEPVQVDELKDAVLAMIVREFGDRALTWDVATMALSIAGFEIRQTALFTGGTQAAGGAEVPFIITLTEQASHRHGPSRPGPGVTGKHKDFPKGTNVNMALRDFLQGVTLEIDSQINIDDPTQRRCSATRHRGIARHPHPLTAEHESA